MPDLLGYRRPTKPKAPLTDGARVRRAVRRAISATGNFASEVPAGPIAERLKMDPRQLVRLWLQDGPWLAYAWPTIGEKKPDEDHSWVDTDPNPAAILLGEDGE